MTPLHSPSTVQNRWLEVWNLEALGMYQFNNGIDDYDLCVLPVHKVKPLNTRIKVAMAATMSLISFK